MRARPASGCSAPAHSAEIRLPSSAEPSSPAAADGTRAARRASPSAAGARRARAAPRARSRVNASTIRLVSLYGYVCSTYPADGRRRLIRSRAGADAGVVGPRLAHLDPGAQVHLAAEELFHVLARRARHALEALAARAEHDRLLARARPGWSPRCAAAALLLEAVDHHLAAVRQLLAHLLEDFRAGARGEEALVAVGELVGRVRRRRLGQRLAQRLEQLADVLPVFALTGTMAAKSRVFDRRSRNGMSRRMLDQVDLVHRGDDTLRGGDLVEHRTVLGTEAQRLHHEKRHIGVARRLGRAAVQPAVQAARFGVPAHRRRCTGSRPREDAGDQVARGLRLGRRSRPSRPRGGSAGSTCRCSGARQCRSCRSGARSLQLSSNAFAASCSARWRECLCPRRAHPRRCIHLE